MGEKVERVNKIDRKKLKRAARKDLKANYFKAILVSFIFVFAMGGGYQMVPQVWFENEPIKGRFSAMTDRDKAEGEKEVSEIVEEVTGEVANEVERETVSWEEKSEAINGVLAPVVNQITKDKSVFSHLIDSYELFMTNKDYGAGTISLLTSLVLLLFYIFVKLVLRVGKNRFFLESRRYKKTFVGRVIYPYRTRLVMRMSITLFLREFYEFLWLFTIVGYPIKCYQYLMIPYVLAENPNIKTREAFSLSKEMMRGRKWEAFKLDLSLLGWKILEVGTFGLSGIFFSGGYTEYIWAEFYAEQRKRREEFTYGKLLADETLFIGRSENAEYPEGKSLVELREFKINTDYDRKYSVRNLILFFFTFSFVGWIWEVTLHLVQCGQFVNRGTMHGPWLPIYGVGGVLILVLLRRFRKKPAVFFIATMVVSGILEYATHWYLQTFKGMEWWDYHGYFLNINGRICLEGLLVFAMGGAGVTYFVAPVLDTIYNRLKPEVAVLICAVLITGFGVDAIYSSKHPNIGEGITSA